MAEAKASGTRPSRSAREIEPAHGVKPERERQRVAEHERDRAERRAPTIHRSWRRAVTDAHAPQRAHHDGEPGDQPDRQADSSARSTSVDARREHRAVLARR